MRIRRFVASSLLALAVVAAVGTGMSAFFTEAEAAGPCICPMVYSPVKCDNGKTYSNLCFARCANAKNCVPVIVIPPPI